MARKMGEDASEKREARGMREARKVRREAG
jgi:hypothetical protein